MTDQLAADGLEPDSATPDVDPDELSDVAVTAGRFEKSSDGAVTTGRRRRRQRISRWDRPPDPHDWRFFVGNLGKVLIATGLLMFGFVAYQLWGTGIETARAQSALKSEFQELIAERRAAADQAPDEPVDPGPSPTTPGSGAPDDDVSTAVIDQPGIDQPGIDSGPVDGLPADPAAVTDGDTGAPAATVDEPLVPVEQGIPPIFRGEPLALLEIPAIGRSDIVVPGVSLDDLKDGPGHYPETPLPGQLGNAAIAGHRTTYGAPFFDVDDLVPGDELIVTMLTGDRFVYEVTRTEIVAASDYWVVTTRDPTIAELTLTSCHPKYTARDRIVIHSVLNPAKSAAVGVPTAPYVVDADDEPIPGDDPVLVADQPVDDPETPAQPGNSPPAGDEQVGTGSPPEVGDAFTQGWFDDRAAFVQIALWGIALTLISLGAYSISRRYRHHSYGFLIGIAPFLFALYFFYQNVNRLLPPGL